jgi:hypothetical protein
LIGNHQGGWQFIESRRRIAMASIEELSGFLLNNRGFFMEDSGLRWFSKLDRV